jgi:aerobic carbon-monoxide dehydrogenase medium subunit
MKPAPFDYYAPANVAEALDLLSDLGYDVKVLAGGQSLVPAMNFRLAQPPALLDLNNISELSYIRSTPEGGVVIGAMTRDSAVEHDPLVLERFPVIKEAMVTIAHPQIRNRGTFGGAIAHGDPTGQLPSVTLALGADYHLRSKTGERVVPADEFYLGSFTTVIEPEELLVEVEIPPLPAHSGACYKQMARQAGAQALVGVTAVVTLDDKGVCQNVRLGYLSVSETPALASEAANVLMGQAPTLELIQKAAETAANVDFDPAGDIHCSPEYRRRLIEVLTVQALTEAVERAK